MAKKARKAIHSPDPVRMSSEEVFRRVTAILVERGWAVRIELDDPDLYDIFAEREERGTTRRLGIWCISRLSPSVLQSTINKWNDASGSTVDELWIVAGTISTDIDTRFIDMSLKRVRILTLEQFDHRIRPLPRTRAPRRRRGVSARTPIGKAIVSNHPQLIATCEAMILQLADRVQVLREERPNSDEAIAERDKSISDYETLSAQVEKLQKAVIEFSESKLEEKEAVKSANSFARGVTKWWEKQYERICNSAFDMSMFITGMGVCYATGANMSLAVLITGALAGNKRVVDVIKAWKGKKL